MAEYTCYTNVGKWKFEAYHDKDALHFTLYHCWRDSKEFFASKAPKAMISK